MKEKTKKTEGMATAGVPPMNPSRPDPLSPLLAKWCNDIGRTATLTLSHSNSHTVSTATLTQSHKTISQC